MSGLAYELTKRTLHPIFRETFSLWAKGVDERDIPFMHCDGRGIRELRSLWWDRNGRFKFPGEYALLMDRCVVSLRNGLDGKPLVYTVAISKNGDFSQWIDSVATELNVSNIYTIPSRDTQTTDMIFSASELFVDALEGGLHLRECYNAYLIDNIRVWVRCFTRVYEKAVSVFLSSMSSSDISTSLSEHSYASAALKKIIAGAIQESDLIVANHRDDSAFKTLSSDATIHTIASSCLCEFGGDKEGLISSLLYEKLIASFSAVMEAHCNNFIKMKIGTFYEHSIDQNSQSTEKILSESLHEESMIRGMVLWLKGRHEKRREPILKIKNDHPFAAILDVMAKKEEQEKSTALIFENSSFKPKEIREALCEKYIMMHDGAQEHIGRFITVIRSDSRTAQKKIAILITSGSYKTEHACIYREEDIGDKKATLYALDGYDKEVVYSVHRKRGTVKIKKENGKSKLPDGVEPNSKPTFQPVYSDGVVYLVETH